MSAIVLGDRGSIPKEINMVFRPYRHRSHPNLCGPPRRHDDDDSYFCAEVHSYTATTSRVVKYFSYIYLCASNRRLDPGDACCLYSFHILASYIFELESDALNSLCAAALLILLMNADNLFDTSFSTFFCCGRSHHSFVQAVGREVSFLPRWMAVALSVSTSAWVGITPVQLWHFGTITPIALIANLFIVPY